VALERELAHAKEIVDDKIDKLEEEDMVLLCSMRNLAIPRHAWGYWRRRWHVWSGGRRGG